MPLTDGTIQSCWSRNNKVRCDGIFHHNRKMFVSKGQGVCGEGKKFARVGIAAFRKFLVNMKRFFVLNMPALFRTIWMLWGVLGQCILSWTHPPALMPGLQIYNFQGQSRVVFSGMSGILQGLENVEELLIQDAQVVVLDSPILRALKISIESKLFISTASLSTQDLDMRVDFGWLAGSKCCWSQESLVREIPQSVFWREENQEEGVRVGRAYGVLGFLTGQNKKHMSCWQVQRLNLQGSRALHCDGQLRVRHLDLGKATLRVSGMLEGNELRALSGGCLHIQGLGLCHESRVSTNSNSPRLEWYPLTGPGAVRLDSIRQACKVHNAGGMLYVGSSRALEGRLSTQSLSLSPLCVLPLRDWRVNAQKAIRKKKLCPLWQPWTFIAGVVLQRNVDVNLEDPLSGRLMLGTYLGDARYETGVIVATQGLWSQWNAWMGQVLGSFCGDWMAHAAAYHFAFKQGDSSLGGIHPCGLHRVDACLERSLSSRDFECQYSGLENEASCLYVDSLGRHNLSYDASFSPISGKNMFADLLQGPMAHCSSFFDRFDAALTRERVYIGRIAPDPGGELIVLGKRTHYTHSGPWKGGIIIVEEALQHIEIKNVEHLLLCGDMPCLKSLKLQAGTLMHLGTLQCEHAEISGNTFTQWSGFFHWNQQKIIMKNSDWSYGPAPGQGRRYEHIRWLGPSIFGVPDHPIVARFKGGNPVPNLRFGAKSIIKNLHFSCTKGVYTDPLQVEVLTLGGLLKLAGDGEIKTLVFSGSAVPTTRGLPSLEVGPLKSALTLNYYHGMGQDHCGTREYLHSITGDMVMTAPALVRIHAIEYASTKRIERSPGLGSRGEFLKTPLELLGRIVNQGGFLTLHGVLDQRQVILEHKGVKLLAGNGAGSAIITEPGFVFPAQGAVSGVLEPETMVGGGIIRPPHSSNIWGVGRYFTPHLVCWGSQVLPGQGYVSPGAVLSKRRGALA